MEGRGRVPVVTELDADEQVGTELSATAEVATPLPFWAATKDKPDWKGSERLQLKYQNRRWYN